MVRQLSLLRFLFLCMYVCMYIYISFVFFSFRKKNTLSLSYIYSSKKKILKGRVGDFIPFRIFSFFLFLTNME